MTCSCKTCAPCSKMSVICLGRCDLRKHKCLRKKDVKPGPIPKHMGWHYNAKHSPEHQLRCGWRPGHIFCPVLRRMEMYNCMKSDNYGCQRKLSKDGPPCLVRASLTDYPPSLRNSSSGLGGSGTCPTCNGSSSPPCQGQQPYIRVIRKNGQYTICTKPSNISNAPSGPFPLKYVLNVDPKEEEREGTRYSIEAKFNDYQFDYISSETSFVLDFTPPEQRCIKPCKTYMQSSP